MPMYSQVVQGCVVIKEASRQRCKQVVVDVSEHEGKRNHGK